MEDLLQKHKLMEADMAIQAEKIHAVIADALKFASGDGRMFAQKTFLLSVFHFQLLLICCVTFSHLSRMCSFVCLSVGKILHFSAHKQTYCAPEKFNFLLF